jgi:ATP/ADP translocase
MLNKLLQRVVSVEPDEVRPMLLSGLYFFLIMAGYFIIRPLRDEMGIAGGVRNLPWLFTGTLVGMLLTHPIYTAMVSRLPRRRFIPLSYNLFALCMLVFFVLLGTLPETQTVWVGRAFYIWTSVFNLFVVSIFWSIMADIFKPGQGARLFGHRSRRHRGGHRRIGRDRHLGAADCAAFSPFGVHRLHRDRGSHRADPAAQRRLRFLTRPDRPREPGGR